MLWFFVTSTIYGNEFKSRWISCEFARCTIERMRNAIFLFVAWRPGDPSTRFCCWTSRRLFVITVTYPCRKGLWVMVGLIRRCCGSNAEQVHKPYSVWLVGNRFQARSTCLLYVLSDMLLGSLQVVFSRPSCDRLGLTFMSHRTILVSLLGITYFWYFGFRFGISSCWCKPIDDFGNYFEQLPWFIQ